MMSVGQSWLRSSHSDMFGEFCARFWRITLVTLTLFVCIRFIYGSRSASRHFRLRFGLMQDERHLRAGCLLSLLFLVPSWVTPECNWFLLGSFVIGYAFVLVPVLTGVYNVPYQSDIPRLARSFKRWILNQIRAHLETIPVVIITILVELPQIYRNVPGVHTVVRKIVFLTLLNASQTSSTKIVAMDFIMCHAMVSYAWNSLKNCKTSSDFYNLTPKDVAKICSCAMVFCYFGGKVQSSSNSLSQLYSSFAYLVLTEPIVEEFISRELKFKRYLIFEDLEELYVPLVLQLVQILASAYMCACLHLSDIILLILALYTCIYIPWEQTLVLFYRPLLKELKIMGRYKRVSTTDLETYSDPTCPICLDDMDEGRMTPCKHCFHGICLRRSLKVSSKCPKCRQDLD